MPLRGSAPDDLGLRPLTSRSVIASVLLGSHPPRLPVRAIVRVGQLFAIPEGTIRVALSRMAADDEIRADNGTYHLTGRLLDRAARQDESRTPQTRRWTSDWELAVVTATGRAAADRAGLRRAMLGLHLAEQREGVWLRPANLEHPQPPPAVVDEQCEWFTSRPTGDPVRLAGSLWDLEAWADQSRRLHTALDQADGLAEGFMVSAAVLRHLLADPLLPPELLPEDWPGAELRERYERFDADYREALRAYAQDSSDRSLA